MPTYKVSEMKGVVRDVGFGKLPDGTFNTLTNFDTNYEQGSLVSRSGYSSAISAPAALTAVNTLLSTPVSYPASADNFILCDNSGTKRTYLYPYYHYSSTLTSNWVDTRDFLTVTSFSSVASTIEIVTPTASSVNDYYKNWVFIKTSTGVKYFVTGYNGTTKILTLDRVAPSSAGATGTLIRYHHDQNDSYSNANGSTPTSPACYSSDLAVRWSLGNSSGVDSYNQWAGYINKVFFNSDTTNRYTFTGTYITEAECKAPTIANLGTPVLSAVTLGTNGILNSIDRDYYNQLTNNWAAAGSATKSLSTLTLYPKDTGSSIEKPIGKDFPVMHLSYTATGSTNYVGLPSTSSSYILLTSGNQYSFRVKYFNSQSTAIKLTAAFFDTATTTDQDINLTLFPSSSTQINPELTETNILFTPSAAFNRIRLYVDTISSIQIGSVDIFLVSSVTVDEVKTSTTYTLYGSYVYDGFQESELVKLDDIYHTTSQATLAYTLKLDFAPLNKRITAVRTYIDIADGDQTLNTNRNFTKYLLKDISIADNDASWVLTSTLYQRTFTIAGVDIKTALSNYTWEQKTNRIASTSTTCSYAIAKSSSGRVFLSNEYDYTDSKYYNSRVRYTGFNGDGIMCPDIFPNITDRNITYVTAGTGVKINALSEYDGNLIVAKEGSIVELTTGDIVELWRMRIVDNNFSSLGKNSILKTEKGIIFGGVDDMIIWRGGDTRSIVEGIWKNLYQSEVDPANINNFYIVQNKYNKEVEVFHRTDGGDTTSYKFSLTDFVVKSNTYYNLFIGFVILKDNTIYGIISNGTIYSFGKTYFTDNGTTFAPIFTTNKLLPDSKHRIILSELFLTVEGSGTINSSSNLFLYGDGDTTNELQYFTINGSSLNSTIKFYRFKVKPHKPVKYVQLRLFSGLNAASVNGLKIHEFGFEFEAQKDFGDVTYT